MCSARGVDAHVTNGYCVVKRMDIRCGSQLKCGAGGSKEEQSEKMDPRMRMKIMIKKLGAELKRAEKNMEVVEECLHLARSAIHRVEDNVNVEKMQISRMKETWRSIVKEMEEIKLRAIMEESLNEDFDIEEEMEEGGKDAGKEDGTSEEGKGKDGRCEAVGKEETCEAVVMTCEVVSMQCDVVAVGGKAAGAVEEERCEEVERIEKTISITTASAPIWS